MISIGSSKVMRFWCRDNECITGVCTCSVAPFEQIAFVQVSVSTKYRIILLTNLDVKWTKPMEPEFRCATNAQMDRHRVYLARVCSIRPPKQNACLLSQITVDLIIIRKTIKLNEMSVSRARHLFELLAERNETCSVHAIYHRWWWPRELNWCWARDATEYRLDDHPVSNCIHSGAILLTLWDGTQDECGFRQQQNKMRKQIVYSAMHWKCKFSLV